MALLDCPETMFALLCISIALPSGSASSTTSEAYDMRDCGKGVTVITWCCFWCQQWRCSLWSLCCKLLHCLLLSNDLQLCYLLTVVVPPLNQRQSITFIPLEKSKAGVFMFSPIWCTILAKWRVALRKAWYTCRFGGVLLSRESLNLHDLYYTWSIRNILLPVYLIFDFKRFSCNSGKGTAGGAHEIV